MSAEKFFNTHSLEEISQKTKISPISLRLIRNKEFDKIPKVKFLGFINIIQKTYNVDLSDLVEEYNRLNQTNLSKKDKPKINYSSQNSNSTIFITILALILIIVGGFLLFNNNKQKNIIKNIPNTEVITSQNISNNKIIDKNISIKNIIITKPKKIKETNTSKKIISKKFSVTIVPNEKIWFKATNIDTNKSIEYLTTHKKILPKGNYYIKFGHGEFNLTYNNQTISPNTRKIVRILLKNGKYEFMKKPNRYEK